MQGEELSEKDFLVFVMNGWVLFNKLALQHFHLWRVNRHHRRIDVELWVPTSTKIWLKHHSRSLDLTDTGNTVLKAVGMNASRWLLFDLLRLIWALILALVSTLIGDWLWIQRVIYDLQVIPLDVPHLSRVNDWWVLVLNETGFLICELVRLLQFITWHLPLVTEEAVRLNELLL